MFRLRAITILMILLLLPKAFLQAQESDSADTPVTFPATFETYIVQSGESLYILAERFDTTIEALMEANNIQEPAQLRAGQSLLLPTGASAYVDVYEIQPGDTLFSISKRFNIDIGILQGLNNIADSRSIIAGQTLLVPSVNQAELQIHVVAADDSIYSIAHRYNTAVSALMSLNGLTGPRDLTVGKTILVPRIDERKYEVYEIQPGDTLLSVSRQFNTDVAQLRALNGIGGRLDMTVGRSLIVPRVDETLFESIVVESGDSLFAIAQRYRVSLAVLQALNGLPDPRDIQVGQTILLPKLADAVLEIHIVKLGDNLTKIAETYDSTVDFLQLLNGIADPSLIQLDDVILVPVPKTNHARPGFGFGLQVFSDGENASALAEQAAELGADWVKIDAPWQEIEAEPGIYNYSTLDATVAAMNLEGLKILLNVFAAPAWSRAAYTEKLNSQLRDFGGPPANLKDFASFLANLATRYAGIVDAYEIWKSPNLIKYWLVPIYQREPELNADGDYGIPDRVQLGARFYLPLLQTAYETIKSHDEAALVISGGLAPVGFSDGYNSIDTGSYLQNMLAAGAADYSDAIGAVFSASAVPPAFRCCDQPPGIESHYESFLQYFPDLMQFYHETLTENDLAGAPIMVTQMGWGTSDGSNIAIPSSGYEWLTYTSEDEQALYVTQAYEIAQDMPSISAMFLHNLNGCAVGDEEACFFSLVDAAGSQRPAYAAYAALPKSANA